MRSSVRVLIATDVSPIPGELAISIISIAELQFGVLIAPDHARAARLNRLSAIQRRFDPLPVDDPKQRRPDITRARTLLGWEPKVGLEEGLMKTVDYFKQKLAADG